MKHSEVKIKIVECNVKTNLVVLQTNSATFTITSKEMVEFLKTASEIKEKKPSKNPILNEIASEILEYLNLTCNRKFPVTDNNLSFISARLSEGEKPELLKQIIDIKSWAWKNDYSMRKYLRPETLFNPTKFQSYKQEVLDVIADPQQFKKYVKAKEDERTGKEYDPLDSGYSQK
ncbi:putative phage protein (TIGR02220 family) [Chryseobacterium rhizosphaerae]|uniref:conserved phage C-terminal domain-containing protein n=1 Tax=Chryseobacterium rhizosphaerae TaxID=395937 RepID=UPI00285DC151|nr:conserved phage C-terminal domain-containing protein [Chryseobacterium rhizosphaerae]MDR6548504.1 putative phage protein (TIGR02220 family) [Chryseobacterium rhizosphaerae]